MVLKWGIQVSLKNFTLPPLYTTHLVALAQFVHPFWILPQVLDTGLVELFGVFAL
ncbi:hypothetical protein RDI58_024216 [Solanum bulbocastanum]|uniref:Uncharacterized protein n=1 Tax=Solanum bulbocastanum TaxID=147425 RepID=A0AAN8T0M7_SOLBU